MEQGVVYEKRVTEVSSSEFMSYGKQRETEKIGKPLLRKTKEGKILKWCVQQDDSLCTLQEAFEKVEPKLGFNIELKLDDNLVYSSDHLSRLLLPILQVQILDFECHYSLGWFGFICLTGFTNECDRWCVIMEKTDPSSSPAFTLMLPSSPGSCRASTL